MVAADLAVFAELCVGFVVCTPPSVLLAWPQVPECAVDVNGTACVRVADSFLAVRLYFMQLVSWSIGLIAAKEGLLLALLCHALARRSAPASTRSAGLMSIFSLLLVVAEWLRLDEQLAADVGVGDAVMGLGYNGSMDKVNHFLCNLYFSLYVNQTGVDPVSMLSMALPISGLAAKLYVALALLWR